LAKHSPYLRLLAEDTIDTAILEALNRKAQLGPQLLGAAPSQDPVSDLTHAQFCELLTTNQLPEPAEGGRNSTGNVTPNDEAPTWRKRHDSSSAS
jgi:hypothetical protein